MRSHNFDRKTASIYFKTDENLGQARLPLFQAFKKASHPPLRNPGYAPGYDDIPTKPIKAAAHSLPLILSSIFNSCLESGHYPDELKIAQVTLLHKGSSKSEMKN